MPVPVLIGTGAGVLALSPTVQIPAAAVTLLLTAGIILWTLWSPSRWLVAFFFAALLLPPLPLPGGDSGLSVAPLLAGAGMVISWLSLRYWRPVGQSVTGCLMLFIGALVFSLPLALLYSGWQIAVASAVRVLLFSISLLVFVFAYAGPRADGWNERRFIRYLFGLAVAGAAFAIADFYFQFPAPAGFGEQFVWLHDSVLRRAQGLFYEASTLGNFCAFFLTMVAVAVARDGQIRIFPRWVLAMGGLLLSGALVFSYSRASVVNLSVALAVLTCLRLRSVRRPLIILASVLMVSVAAIHVVNPELSSNYWGRLFGSFSFFLEAPNKVLSGRLTNWSVLTDFLAAHPWQAALGVGYKTLPYSSYIGQPVVADNTYLGLLIETGLLGIFSFLALHAAILVTGWRAVRSMDVETAFLGEWIFCFWCGEMVQMFSGDLITYWRVLPVYFWVLGAAARRSREV